MISKLPISAKQRIALTVTLIAGGIWALDALTKSWAAHTLGKQPLVAIPGLLYFALGINHGGSNGIAPEFMELCLALPATIMFCAVLWLGRSLRAGKSITLLQQIGLGLFLGGALSNWSERVLYHGVTDFIYLQPLGFCIFNLADVFIDCGNMIFLLETLRVLWKRKAEAAKAAPSATPVISD